MTLRTLSSLQRVLPGTGALLGLLALTMPAAAQSGDTSAAAPAAASDAPAPEKKPEPPPPPPPPAPALLTAAPAADTVKDKVSYEAPKEDALSLNLSAGAAAAFGNTKAYQLSAGGDFRWVSRPHSLSANALWLMGGTKPREATEYQTTTENLNARGKYELFLSDLDSLFVGVGLRQDRFAGMRPRFNAQLGYGRYFIAEEKVRFWGEIGYDFMLTHYARLPGGPALPGDFDNDKPVHSARLFVGLEHQLHDYLSYVGGLEGFINVEKPGASRFVFDNALRSTLSGSFKLELKARFMYEAKPVVPGAKKLDTALLASLLYSVI